MNAKSPQPRAIGIVRVSQPGDRDEANGHFHSPENQRDRIRTLCDREGWRLLDIYDPELRVPGSAPLADRPALSRAVTAVLTGSADRIVGGYTERLWRSNEVRSQVLRLVEDAGGQVWSADDGRLTNGTAAAKFNGTVRTAADELMRDQSKEKSRAAVVRAIANGVPPWPNVTPGYTRAESGKFVPTAKAATVREAFELRADGATVADVRTYLAEHDIITGYHGTTALLKSRVVLGEINFGQYEPNLSAHPAIVPVDLWQRVQRVSTPRGRKPKSERLLARLGVLVCSGCGGRMVVGTQKQNGRTYPFYRCGHVREDCPQRVAVSAVMVEEKVTTAVRAAIADEQGRASAEHNARDAEDALATAQADLDAALRAFAGLADEPAAVERLGALRDARDAARDRLEQLGGVRAAVTVSASADWDRLTLAERRALIRATVARVTVAPGRGAGRITVELV